MNTYTLTETKKYAHIRGMFKELLPTDDLNEGFVFEWNGAYQLEVSNIDGVLKVTNGVNGWGNNCKDEFKDAEVEILQVVSPLLSGAKKEDIQPVLRWVKASERLPEKKEVVCRLIGTNVYGLDFNPVLGFWIDHAYCTDNSKVEWLEEVEQPVPSIENYGASEAGDLNDFVPNVLSPDVASVASHSCTFNDSIQQNKDPLIEKMLVEIRGKLVYNEFTRLLKEHLGWHPTELRMASAKYFVEKGSITGGFFEAIRNIAHQYSAFVLEQPLLNKYKNEQLKSNSEPVIDWEGLEDAASDVYEYCDIPKSFFNWLKSNLTNYIKVK